MNDIPDINEPSEPETDPTTEQAPAPEQALPMPPRRLRRSTTNTYLGGVAAHALAAWLGIDPKWTRLGFIVGLFAAGAAIPLYLAGWILLPDDTDPDPRQFNIRGETPYLLFGALALGAFLALGWQPNVIVALSVLAIGFLLLNERPAAAPTSGSVATAGSAYPPPPAPGATPSAAPWATNPAPVVEREPVPPVTTIALAVAALVATVMIILRAVTGLDIPAVAVVGAAAGIMAVGLIVGAVVGGGRLLWLFLVPLMFLGLPLALGIDEIAANGVGRVVETPTTAAAIEPSYHHGVGEFVLDLSEVDFTEGTKAVTIDQKVGRVKVILPDDVDANVTARPDVGDANLFGVDYGNVDITVGSDTESRASVDLTIDLNVGDIEVSRVGHG